MRLFCLSFLLTYFTRPNSLYVCPCIGTFHDFITPYGCIIFPCVYVPEFLSHLSVEGHLACFQRLAIVISVAMTTGVRMAFLCGIFVFLGYIPRTGIAVSYRSSISRFLRDLHVSFHNDWTSRAFPPAVH